MKNIEIINGVESARSIFKNCSCGIDYGNKENYKKHLIECHMSKGELING